MTRASTTLQLATLIPFQRQQGKHFVSGIFTMQWNTSVEKIEPASMLDECDKQINTHITTFGTGS
jgi:hypothetical protein